MRVPRLAAGRLSGLSVLALLIGLSVSACGSVTPVAHDGGGGTAGHGDGSMGVDAPADSGGNRCNSDQDCKQYSDGVGGCCGACVPASDPQPASVQCLLPCTTPIKSCGCSNHQCVASTS
ncbi:MAG TPA: hypothetical protein VFG23_21610 [Polyangia bacterium]|nr:hypothetical protein [Polyangia bacterium]